MISKKTKIKRLKMMSKMLKNHKKIFPTTKFDMEHWICGTAACAVGSACNYTPFKKLGLRTTSGGDAPEYKGEASWEAVRKFFGLRNNDERKLFSHWSYKSTSPRPSTVAKRIDAYIKGMNKR